MGRRHISYQRRQFGRSANQTDFSDQVTFKIAAFDRTATPPRNPRNSLAETQGLRDGNATATIS